jgi:hypothetical protein
MAALAIVLVAVATAAGMCAILVARRRRRTPPELRGDWWGQFERDFRAYAAGAARSPRDRRRRRGEPA